MRVATRPNPKINIGPVDVSSAVIVCDIIQHDHPIIYCSEAFELLDRLLATRYCGEKLQVSAISGWQSASWTETSTCGSYPRSQKPDQPKEGSPGPPNQLPAIDKTRKLDGY